MKIRVTGTKDECEQAQVYYGKFGRDSELVKSCTVSNLYPNRNSVNQYRVYIDIECNDFNQAMTNALTLKE